MRLCNKRFFAAGLSFLLMILFHVTVSQNSSAVSAFPSLLISVDAGKCIGSMPTIMRPGVDIAQWGQEVRWPYYREKFIEGQKPKLLRTGLLLDQTLARSAKDMNHYLSMLDIIDEQYILPFKNAGASIVFTIYGMPKWLSSRCFSDSTGRYACLPDWDRSPPRSLTAWQDFVRTIVARYKNRGIIMQYEIWNEPDQNYCFGSTDFWTGTQGQYHQLYEYAVYGARQADPTVLIGGPASSVANRHPSCNGKSPVEEFILYAKSKNLPISFISSHSYVNWNGFQWNSSYAPTVSAIKGWLTASGYSAQTPQLLTEWNYDGGFGKIKEHDTHMIAAYIPYAIKKMYDDGVSGQDFFQLTDFNNEYKINGGYHGTLYLTGIIKASYNAYRALSLLSGKAEGSTPDRLSVNVSGDGNDKITALASKTTDGKTTRLLISYFPGAIETNAAEKMAKVTITNLSPGTYVVRSYRIDKDASNACGLNKSTDPTPDMSVCGTGGIIEQKIDSASVEARKQAILSTTAYLQSTGFTASEIKLSIGYIEVCRERGWLKEDIDACLEQESKFTGYQLTQLQSAATIYEDKHYRTYFFDAADAIDRINKMAGVSLESSSVSTQITINNGSYQTTRNMQPYSLELIELIKI